jgi:hypothetical protein
MMRQWLIRLICGSVLWILTPAKAAEVATLGQDQIGLIKLALEHTHKGNVYQETINTCVLPLSLRLLTTSGLLDLLRKLQFD